jgi:hypothetical protein
MTYPLDAPSTTVPEPTGTTTRPPSPAIARQQADTLPVTGGDVVGLTILAAVVIAAGVAMVKRGREV